METLKQYTTDFLIFIAAFLISTGACAKRTVTCGDSSPAPQEVHSAR
jgi:hypothetical protein